MPAPIAAMRALIAGANLAGPWQPEVKVGAQLLMDFQGVRTGGKPYVWLRGTRYSSVDKIPGWTFSRASAGYAEGLVEDQTTNLLARSQDFSASPWVATGNVATPNVAIAPDGTMTANRFTTVNTGQPKIEQPPAGMSVGSYAASVYVKYETARWALMSFYDGTSSESTAVFDLVNVTAAVNSGTQFSAPAITPIAGGWYRISLVWTRPNGAGSGFKIGCSNAPNLNTPTAGLSNLFWGAQIEPGTVPSPNVIATGATAVTAASGRGQVQGLKLFGAGEPRITDKGLLVEEARTNLLFQSQTIGAAAWATNATTKAASAVLAPDGSATATQVVTTNTGANIGYILQSVSSPAFGTYAISFFVKSDGATGARIQPEGMIDSTNSGCVFNLTYATGVVTTSEYGGKFSVVSASATRLANGWFRVIGVFTLSGTTPSSINVRLYPYLPGDAVGVGSIAWQGDLQLGAFMTSPIITAGAAATRAADSAYITGLGPILGQFRTNTLTQSQAFAGSEWSKFGAQITVTDNVAAAPDGTMTAAQFSPAGAGTAVRALYKSSPTGNQQAYVSGQTYTQSWFVKAGTGIRYIQLPMASAGFSGNWYANFDLQTGTVTATSGSVSPSIAAVDNGWYRVAVTATANASSAAADGGYLYAVSSGTATFGMAGSFSGGETMFVWGADFKSGLLSDYIPTTTAPASAGNLYTVAVSADLPLNDGTPRSLAWMDEGLNNGANRAGFLRGADNSAQTWGGATAFVVTNKGGARVLKMAARFGPTGFRSSTDGVLGVVTAGVSPVAANRVNIGATSQGTSPLNGYVQRVGVYGDTADGALQTLTN